MKKIFTLIGLLCGSIAAMATDYNGTMIVTVSGTVTEPQQTTIEVSEDAGTYKLTLQDFCLTQDGQTMAIGTINVGNIPYETDEDGTVLLSTEQYITIENGSYTPASGMWMGPILGQIPIALEAAIADGTLGVGLDISFMGMQIEVYFGSGTTQIGNSDFENFHTATLLSPETGEVAATSDEPNNWHSFMSTTSYDASGVNNPVIGYLAGFAPHTFISDVTRPGSAGSKSVLVTSANMVFAIANGTITTGRLNAGSTTATDLLNHSYLDFSQTDVDANGDPFYARLNADPDSIAVWVKFNQGTPNAEHPYATISAVITDGTYYQDPEDKTYTNVVAKAQNSQIESNGGAWQRISIPFDYNSYLNNEAETKAILVTISTNADAGQGSTDSIYVDDLSLIYNSQLSDIMVFDRSIDGFDKDTYTYNVTVAQMPTEEDIEPYENGEDGMESILISGNTAIINVYAGDLQSYHTYTINFTVDATGINTVGKSNNVVRAYYNMAGQQITTPARGKMYIVKYADGKAVKVIKD